jgi:hypothetical protein
MVNQLLYGTSYRLSALIEPEVQVIAAQMVEMSQRIRIVLLTQ